ncbi:uracil-DNA glycosylase [Myroides pelagicus]|uniref:Uracil-DNA glycosylase n=1 Tax=Myroides pelagicus TaxID=270914 RepID=A0A7K1GHH3_9FLAO|nr:uracil-DNA glycosylase [Myroides pelagicus]MEC4114584.1 uracil-DNA glycosylase [Myroides pelagicus]MTH28358.1 uracil-DNA glycosylase [Myroides pelagicus]
MKELLNSQWKEILAEEFIQPYYKSLEAFVAAEYASKKVYPPKEQIFSALNLLPLNDVKVVILGQDPYHGPFQANGLSFSVSKGVKLPPSLVNIYKELQDDLGINNKLNGDLTPWATQGVLLLNATLTVVEKQAGAHQKKGWETFTDAIVKKIAEDREGVVFILWGSYAQKKGKSIDRSKHLVIETAHPSPLSVYRGFYGSKPFSKTNEYLVSKGLKAIDWQV